MPAAQVAVADYCPNRWPAAARLLIRRVRLDVAHGAVSADPRARRRRTLHPTSAPLPLPERAALAAADPVCGYWYRHRTQVENVFRDANHGVALRHLCRSALRRARSGTTSSSGR